MKDPLLPEDYEKLYEDGLLELTRAVTAVSCSSTSDHQETSLEERRAASRVLIARANLDGVVQQQSTSATSSRRVRESAEALLQQWQVDECSKSYRPTEDAIWQKSLKTRPNTAAGTNAGASRGGLDDFFDAYPECMRNPDGESDESDDDEDGKAGAMPLVSRKPVVASRKRIDRKENPDQGTRAASNPYKRQSDEGRNQRSSSTVGPPNRPSSSRSTSSNPGSSFQYTPIDLTGGDKEERPVAPRISHRHEQHHTRPDPQHPSYDQRKPAPDTSSWEDHQRQNPFQSAREYNWAGGSAAKGKRENERRPSHPQQPRPPHAPLTNPYASAPSSLPKEAPVIRDSLKRKFQPPSKRPSSSAPAKGGVHSQKASEQRPAKPEEEEDELPEELKRFGKDLVEKIENEIMDGGDPVTFQDIAGLDDAKQTIQEVICWPMKRPDLFTGLRKAPNGLLLYGPPGTGKTLIGKAIAHESGATFFSISSSSLTSKWIGEGEKLVRTMFAVAAYREPSVVFIDEIDSLLTQRKSDENEASRRIKTEFLVQLDGTGTTAQGRVLTIGATNRPQELDEAARRRFVKRLYIPLPVESDRASLLHKLLGTNNHRLTATDVQKLAKETEGFSGADLKALCTDAAMGPIRQLGAQALEVNASDVPPISSRHFRQSLRSMNPSVAPGDLVQYEEWDKTYGSKRVDESLDDDDTSEEE